MKDEHRDAKSVKRDAGVSNEVRWRVWRWGQVEGLTRLQADNCLGIWVNRKGSGAWCWGETGMWPIRENRAPACE